MIQTRMTKQRAVILDALRHVTSHPTADEVYSMVRSKLPHISLGTVYRNLEYLSNSGTIRRLERAGQQMRFDGDMTPHQHIRCQMCGMVGDIFPPIELPACTKPNAPGFEVLAVDIEFVGVCHACQEKRQ